MRNNLNAYGINNLIDTPLWNLIQEKLETGLEWEIAKIEDGKESSIRKSRIAWITDLYLREQLFHSINLYNKQQWNYDLSGSDALQYGIYSDGGYYDWHVDIIDDSIKFPRKLSMTIWLNDPDEYEGGEFDIEVEGPRKDLRYDSLKLPKGSIVVFPSSMWHRVRPVTCGVRKSLVTWFRGAPFR